MQNPRTRKTTRWNRNSNSVVISTILDGSGSTRTSSNKSSKGDNVRAKEPLFGTFRQEPAGHIPIPREAFRWTHISIAWMRKRPSPCETETVSLRAWKNLWMSRSLERPRRWTRLQVTTEPGRAPGESSTGQPGARRRREGWEATENSSAKVSGQKRVDMKKRKKK